MKSEIERRKSTMAAGQTDIVRWSDPAQLEPAWQARSRIAAQFVPAGSRLLDVGCGAMTLEGFLPPECDYRPCDVVARDSRTVVCDLNQGPLPEAALEGRDLVTLLGVLEYLERPDALLGQLAASGRRVLLSYCATDWSVSLDRQAMGWVNHFSLDEIRSMAGSAGFSVKRIEQIDPYQALLLLEPGLPSIKAAKRVLVLSYANAGNFGDRLGVPLIHSVLPPHALVTHATFNPWTVPEGHFDLLVLGIGNSLFAPLLDDRLLALLDRIPKKVGIFGTQYRENFVPARLHAVIDRLDLWLARYEEDVLLYGHGRNNVRHFGDWLIDAFPLVDAPDPQLLEIGAEIMQNLPLDRVIQKIQLHRRVFSTRLHPLLCALCSAGEVAYREQREDAGQGVSGKFRSMLIDVFGRTFPEDTFWSVDRAAVLSYKTRVSGNIAQLRQTFKLWLD